jgi:hypothetical protein
MKKPAPLSERFARLVLWELAEIHAVVLNLSDHAIADGATVAKKPVIPRVQSRLIKAHQRKGAYRRKRIFESLLSQLDLDDSQTPPVT